MNIYLSPPQLSKETQNYITEVLNNGWIAPNGPENDGKFFVKPSDFTWLIYPSSYWHRPGIPQSDKYRYIIAADVDVLS